MACLLKLYADHSLPRIEKRIQEWEDLVVILSCVDVDVQEDDKDVDISDDLDVKISRCVTTSNSKNVISGKISLLKKGIIFCKKQLGEAIVAFKKVLAGDEAWSKVLDELELLDEFEEDPDSSDEYSDCREDEGDNDEAVTMKRAPKDIALPSASMQ